MAESMLQIFQRHRDCFDFTKEPDLLESDEARQLCYERQREREQAANEYVSNILASNDNWAKDVDEDANELALSFQGILNKAERKAYRKATEEFLSYVATVLREHRVKQLSPVTRYRMGRWEYPAMNVITGLSIDEAEKEFQKMKEQGFIHVQIFPKEAFPAVFTAFGYKPKASTHFTAGSNIQKQPATSTGDTPPQPEETSIFTDCIANDYRDKQAIIEAELRKVINGKKGKAAIIVFVACYIHGILRQCPSHQQALYLSKSIGETKHKGYNDQKKKYFSESEEGKRTNGNTAIYDVLKETMLDTIREAIINAETELKTLFVSLDIVTGDTATHQHER